MQTKYFWLYIPAENFHTLNQFLSISTVGIYWQACATSQIFQLFSDAPLLCYRDEEAAVAGAESRSGPRNNRRVSSSNIIVVLARRKCGDHERGCPGARLQDIADIESRNPLWRTFIYSWSRSVYHSFIRWWVFFSRVIGFCGGECLRFLCFFVIVFCSGNGKTCCQQKKPLANILLQISQTS